MLGKIKSYANEDNVFLIKTFVCYIVLWFSFGIIYFLMYVYNPSSFVFNENIISSQSTFYKTQTEEKIRELNRDLNRLEEYRNEYYRWKNSNPQKPVIFLTDIDYVNERIRESKSAIQHYTRRIESITTREPEVWELADFLYFSLITQTTVGYGDILPNNRTVRILITFQLLISLFLIAFVMTGYAMRKKDRGN